MQDGLDVLLNLHRALSQMAPVEESLHNLEVTSNTSHESELFIQFRTNDENYAVSTSD